MIKFWHKAVSFTLYPVLPNVSRPQSMSNSGSLNKKIWDGSASCFCMKKYLSVESCSLCKVWSGWGNMGRIRQAGWGCVPVPQCCGAGSRRSREILAGDGLKVRVRLPVLAPAKTKKNTFWTIVPVSRWSWNYVKPGAGAEITFLIKIYCSQFEGCWSWSRSQK